MTVDGAAAGSGPPLVPGAKSPLVWVIVAVCQAVVLVAVGLWAAAHAAPTAMVHTAVAVDVSGSPVTRAAAEFLELFCSLDPADFAETSAEVLDRATGTLAEQYAAGLDEIRRTLAAGSSVTTAEVVGVGVAEPGRAGGPVELLAFVNTTTAHGGGSPEQPRQFRVRLVMVIVDGVWKASEAEYL